MTVIDDIYDVSGFDTLPYPRAVLKPVAGAATTHTSVIDGVADLRARSAAYRRARIADRTFALEEFIAGRSVNCRQIDYDARNGRPVVQCYAGDDDLQAMMVSAGWAWSFGRYSSRYEPEERDAIVRKTGVHGHRCVPASEWRVQQRH